jgi:ribosomal protein S19
MKTLLTIFVSLLCLFCSKDEVDNTPVPTKEQVIINWSVYSQGIPLAGYATVQVYSGKEYYEIQCTKKSFEIKLKKGDFGILSITPTITDQSQNEAGIIINYVMSNSEGIIVHGTNGGTNFLIK